MASLLIVVNIMM